MNTTIQDLLGINDRKSSKIVNTFGQRLQNAMASGKIDALELSKKTGLSKKQILQYTTGKRMPRHSTLDKLAFSLNVSKTWLLGYNVKKKSQNVKKFGDTELNIKKYFGDDSLEILNLFACLNEIGRKKAIDFLNDLVAIKKYIKDKSKEQNTGE